MAEARKLNPIFLIVHQFNESGGPDEGFDVNTDDDIEPAHLWGYTAARSVSRQIRLYGESPAGGSTLRPPCEPVRAIGALIEYRIQNAGCRAAFILCSVF